MKVSTWMSELSQAARTGLIVSICWLLICLVWSASKNFIEIFVFFGMFPVIIGWGVRWIRKA